MNAAFAESLEQAEREDAFWRRVDVRGDDECWDWQGVTSTYGYGYLNVAGERVASHRRAMELVSGTIPDGQHVLHNCDNPPCVNPAHLRLGTHADNMRDAVKRGRRPKTRPNLRGKLHPNSKLTADNVREIRRRYVRGNGQKLADEFGIDLSQVHNIVRRRQWRHV